MGEFVEPQAALGIFNGARAAPVGLLTEEFIDRRPAIGRRAFGVLWCHTYVVSAPGGFRVVGRGWFCGGVSSG